MRRCRTGGGPTRTGQLLRAIGAEAVTAAPNDTMGRRMAILADASETKARLPAVGPGSVTMRSNRWREILSCPRSSYGLSTLVGLLTYFAYGALNDAWGNLALVGVSLYMLLAIPLYSKLSNWIEGLVSKSTRLETGGRLARYGLQLLINLALLWVFVAGGVVDPAGLEGIGGFFATAAWITVVSQGGQYLAGWLARKRVGNADGNVVWAISVSATVTALAVSGVAWIQPIYVVGSLAFGVAIFGMGVLTDVRAVLSGAAHGRQS